MTKSELLKSLLDKYSLNESELFKSETEKKFLDELNQSILKMSHEKFQNENALNLSFEEMQKVWKLINQRENLIKSILDSSEDIIITMNENGDIIEFNHIAEKVFNKLKIEVQGKHISKIIKGGSLLKDLNIYLDKNSSSSDFYSISHERTIFNFAGEEIPVSVFMNKVVSDQTVFFPLYLRDLSKIKKAEAELDKSRAQIVFSSKLSSLGEMAGGIAHEINTPLAIIQMRTDQLLDSTKDRSLDEAFLKKALESIDLTVKRISKIVKGLRTFARDGSSDEIILTPLSLIIDDTFSLCREKFSINGVELTYQSEGNISIYCRSSEISQVLLNLLNNSFDAIEKNSKKWIHVDVKINLANQVQIEITDSGLGIPLDIQQKMMNPFFTTKDIGKGTGLGLSISKGIIESHGGRIFIDNKSKNTKFIVELPLAS